MEKLTIEYMKQKMREAYDNNLLLAQNAVQFSSCGRIDYFYRLPDSNVGCAVGVCFPNYASLPRDSEYDFTEGGTLSDSAAPNFIDDDAYGFALTAQNLHDRWADACIADKDGALVDPDYSRTLFLQHIEHPSVMSEA